MIKLGTIEQMQKDFRAAGGSSFVVVSDGGYSSFTASVGGGPREIVRCECGELSQQEFLEVFCKTMNDLLLRKQINHSQGGEAASGDAASESGVDR